MRPVTCLVLPVRGLYVDLPPAVFLEREAKGEVLGLGTQAREAREAAREGCR